MLVLGSLLVTACEFIRTPTTIDDFEERIQVHAVLTAGDTGVVVLITRTQRPIRVEDHGRYTMVSIPEPVEGARVWLLQGGDSIQAIAGTEDTPMCRAEAHVGTEPYDYLPGCYWGRVPGGVRTEQSHELRIELPGGGRVTGQTTVPAPPVILEPAPGDSIREWEPLLLRWEPLRDPLVHVHPAHDECRVSLRDVVGDKYGIGPTTSRTDSLGFSLQMTCPDSVEVPSSTPVHLIVTRYSGEYAEYLAFQGHEMGSINEEMAGPGLTGAIGAFAGAAQDSVAIILVDPEG